MLARRRRRRRAAPRPRRVPRPPALLSQRWTIHLMASRTVNNFKSHTESLEIGAVPLSFNLNGNVQATSLGSVYDQWRVTHLKSKFVYLSTGTTTAFETILVGFSYDPDGDTSMATSPEQILDRRNLMTRTLSVVTGSTLSTGKKLVPGFVDTDGIVRKKSWFDAVSFNKQFNYGILAVFINTAAPGTSVVVTEHITLHVELRGQR